VGGRRKVMAVGIVGDRRRKQTQEDLLAETLDITNFWKIGSNCEEIN